MVLWSIQTMNSKSCVFSLIFSFLFFPPVVAMDVGQPSAVQQLFAARKKSQEEKWKIQRSLNKVEWELWWLNWHIKFNNIRMQLRLYPAYYTKRAVAACVITAIAAVVYRVYHTVDETDEPQENNNESIDGQLSMPPAIE